MMKKKNPKKTDGYKLNKEVKKNKNRKVLLCRWMQKEKSKFVKREIGIFFKISICQHWYLSLYMKLRGWAEKLMG